MNYLECELYNFIIVIILIGIFTYSMRAVLFFKQINIMEKSLFKRGLENIKSSLLVVLVVPYAFFVDRKFQPFRFEILAIIITIPIIWRTRKPGLSLLIALSILLFLNQFFKI